MTERNELAAKMAALEDERASLVQKLAAMDARRRARTMHNHEHLLDWAHMVWANATREEVRNAVWRRANGGCQDCGRPGFNAPWRRSSVSLAELRDLAQGRIVMCDMHHLNYRHVRHEAPSDLALLCRECHRARHWTPFGYRRDPEQALELRAFWQMTTSESDEVIRQRGAAIAHIEEQRHHVGL